MAVESIKIPQIGEGLQEARLVATLKQPGESVAKDEPIYQMETDKAVMDVESPVAGTLVEWTAKVDQVLPIGAEVGRIETDGAAVEKKDPAPKAEESEGGETALRIPQIGEGLQEARLVKKLKQPGDPVQKDEAIYQMETDKAVMDVESPYAGQVVRWVAEEDAVLPIGAEVVVLKTAGPVDSEAVKPAATPAAQSTRSSSERTSGARRRDLPPKTRAYAKSKGLDDAQIEALPETGSKLLPEDIDRFVAGEGAPMAKPAEGSKEEPMPQGQRLLASRLQRGSALVVPGTITVQCGWGPIEDLREEVRDGGGEFQPSTFTMFAFAVARALREYPLFRSTLIGEDVVRTYESAHMGIAVGLPDDVLVLARVDDADQLEWREFANATWKAIDRARAGEDQANESVTISLTNMQAFGLRDAVPVVVPPSVATLFLGEPYNALDQEATEPKIVRCANLALTFDHRLINGVGASNMINSVRTNVEGIRDLISP